MTTINTIHDLHRILVEHPEWRSEVEADSVDGGASGATPALRGVHGIHG